MVNKITKLKKRSIGLVLPVLLESPFNKSDVFKSFFCRGKCPSKGKDTAQFTVNDGGTFYYLLNWVNYPEDIRSKSMIDFFKQSDWDVYVFGEWVDSLDDKNYTTALCKYLNSLSFFDFKNYVFAFAYKLHSWFGWQFCWKYVYKNRSYPAKRITELWLKKNKIQYDKLYFESEHYRSKDDIKNNKYFIAKEKKLDYFLDDDLKSCNLMSHICKKVLYINNENDHYLKGKIQKCNSVSEAWSIMMKENKEGEKDDLQTASC